MTLAAGFICASVAVLIASRFHGAFTAPLVEWLEQTSYLPRSFITALLTGASASALSVIVLLAQSRTLMRRPENPMPRVWLRVVGAGALIFGLWFLGTDLRLSLGI
jgi:hypothetical protein